MTLGEIKAELARAQSRLRIAASAKISKQWRQRIHWLESAIAKREQI